tara:strand:- start:25 stop:252 length:228 start_codon:yes stop_codon:yes gene_type:complete
MTEKDKSIIGKAKTKKAIEEAKLAENKRLAFEHKHIEIGMVIECLSDLKIIVCATCRPMIDQIISNVEKIAQEKG